MISINGEPIIEKDGAVNDHAFINHLLTCARLLERNKKPDDNIEDKGASE